MEEITFKAKRTHFVWHWKTCSLLWQNLIKMAAKNVTRLLSPIVRRKARIVEEAIKLQSQKCGSPVKNAREYHYERSFEGIVEADPSVRGIELLRDPHLNKVCFSSPHVSRGESYFSVWKLLRVSFRHWSLERWLRNLRDLSNHSSEKKANFCGMCVQVHWFAGNGFHAVGAADHGNPRVVASHCLLPGRTGWPHHGKRHSLGWRSWHLHLLDQPAGQKRKAVLQNSGR